MNEYDISQTSRHTADVQDIVLADEGDESEARTRKILRAELVNNVHDRAASVKACIMHQRRHSKSTPWQDTESFNLATLHAGQEVRLQLNCGETRRLYKALEDLYALSRDGVPEGDQSLAVVDPEITIIATGQEKRAIAQLIERG